MEIVVKVAAVGMISTLIALVLKKYNSELSIVLVISTVVIVAGASMSIIKNILDFIDTLRETAELSSTVIAPVIKTVGIAMVSRISSDICKDAGQAAIGSTIEMICAVSAVYISLPLMNTALEMITKLL